MTKQLFFKPLTCLFCFLLICVFQSHAQEEQVVEKQAFTSQIGVDFASFVRGEQGLSLMYKQAIPGGLSVFKHHQTALRIGAGFYNDNVDNTTLLTTDLDTAYTQRFFSKSQVQFLRFGVENQINKKNWRFHYGADLGLSYWNADGGSQALKRFSNSEIVLSNSISDTKGRAVDAYFLAGISYFIVPRLSVGIETSMSAGKEFSNTRFTDSNGVSSNFSSSNFNIDFQTWRLLLISFHFGQPKQK